MSENNDSPWVNGGARHWQREGVGYICPMEGGMYSATTWTPPQFGGRTKPFRLIDDAKTWLDKLARSSHQRRREFDMQGDLALEALFARIGA